jgi:hypothetical protein
LRPKWSVVPFGIQLGLHQSLRPLDRRLNVLLLPHRLHLSPLPSLELADVAEVAAVEPQPLTNHGAAHNVWRVPVWVARHEVLGIRFVVVGALNLAKPGLRSCNHVLAEGRQV